jgi:hypothetical protein
MTPGDRWRQILAGRHGECAVGVRSEPAEAALWKTGEGGAARNAHALWRPDARTSAPLASAFRPCYDDQRRVLTRPSAPPTARRRKIREGAIFVGNRHTPWRCPPVGCHVSAGASGRGDGRRGPVIVR